MMSSRQQQQRHKQMYEDLTDDEDSDLEMFTDDSRSRMKRNSYADIRSAAGRRERRNTEQLDLDYRDNEVISRIQRMKEKSRHIRERRSGSLTHWPVTKGGRESGSLTPSDDDDMRKLSSKFRKSQVTSPPLLPVSRAKIQSDSERAEPRVETKAAASVAQKAAKKSPPSDDEVMLENEKRPLTVASSIIQTTIEPQIKSPGGGGENVKIKENHDVTRVDEIVTKIEISTPKPSTSAQAIAENHVKATARRPATEQSAVKQVTTKDAQSSAPPPDVSWECEHCTFVNEPDTKICSICCKTRVEVLKQLPTEVDDDIDINEINDSIQQHEGGEGDAKQKGKIRKITFLPGTKAH
jgi:hypothetical protein